MSAQIGATYTNTSATSQFYVKSTLRVGDENGDPLVPDAAGGSFLCSQPSCDQFLGGSVMPAWDGLFVRSVLVTFENPYETTIPGTYDADLYIPGGVRLLNFSDTTTIEIGTVPIPAAAWLFGSALLGLAGIGRRRSRNYSLTSTHKEVHCGQCNKPL